MRAEHVRRPELLRWIGLIALAATSLHGSAARAGTATVELAAPATTSAGVFDDRGRLVRTLWSAVRENRGPIRIEWDGLDDDGRHVPSTGRYTARILAHNVRYVWEGVIGNTSEDKDGLHVHHAYLRIHDMAFDGTGNGFYVVGYDERQPAMHRFRVADPQRQDALGRDDYRTEFRFVATDGRLVYFANEGLVATRGSYLHNPDTFVLAFDVSSGQEHRFALGRIAGRSTDPQWQSVIDYDHDDEEIDGRFRLAPTGLAVQRHGIALFVAHAGIGTIRILDKRTGALLGQIRAEGAADLAVAPDDSLWALCRTPGRPEIVHFRARGAQWVRDGSISGSLIDPIAIGVSPVDGTVLVADDASEQLEAFDEMGRPLWTLGRKGGYRSGGPSVTHDRFWLSGGPDYIAFQSDGSFWLGDPGNSRNLHFSAARRYLGEIRYLPHSYICAVDANDPGRVFSNFLEFSVDYARPLRDSWRLVRNWRAGLDARYAGEFDGLQSVYTLRNGRTYGVVRRYDTGRNEVVELAASGLRPAGATLDFGTRLYADGSLRLGLVRFGELSVYERRLAGFDSEGNPQWDPPQLMARVASLSARDPYYHDVPLIPPMNEAIYPRTSRGIIVSFDPGASKGFHLGGIEPGVDTWLWRASPSGSWSLTPQGTVEPRDGRYETDDGAQYLGNVALAAGRNIVYGFHGEGWRGGEANQFLHFYDDGLFIGQFGNPWIPRTQTERDSSLPATAGNAFSPQLVEVHGKLYLWHNDESAHSGVHRWRIDGAEDIKLLEAPIAP